MADEITLATEVRELFQTLGAKKDMQVATAWAEHFGTEIGSEQFFLGIAIVKRNLTQLIADIEASRLKARSQQLYIAAVNELVSFVSPHGMISATTSQIAKLVSAFEYLTLVDDVLEPIDNRQVPKETISDLRKAMVELQADLDGADIDGRLKAFLRAQLANVLWALDHFDVVGIDGLSRTFGAAQAEIARSFGLAGASKPAAQAWYQKAWPKVVMIGTAITGLSVVVEKADNLLTHGGNIFGFVTGHDAKKDTPQSHVKIETSPVLPAPEHHPALPKPASA